MGVNLTSVKKLLRKPVLYFATKHRTKNKSLQTLCECHRSDWLSLSEEEKKNAYAKDYNSYLAFKNFGNDGRYDLRDYVTTVEYVGELLPRLNKLNHTLLGSPTHTLFIDKNYSKLLFPEFKHPKTIVHRICGTFFDEDYNRIGQDRALELLNGYESLVFKLSRDTRQGKGVRKVEQKNYRKELEQYGENFVVQEVIKQHENFSYFNSSSVNVVRIISMNWKGNVYILCAKLKVGAPGGFVDLEVTDKYPLEIGINEDGSFDNRAFEAEYEGKIYSTVFGKPIQGIVPNYNGMKELVQKAHSRYPDYGLLGWDLTVDESGDTVFVEVNAKAPAVGDSQWIQGPFFATISKDGRKLKDEIMETELDYKNQMLF